MANNIEQIKQALSAAESSIKLAKQLLVAGEGKSNPDPVTQTTSPERSGTIGIYDGEKMVTSSGDVFIVPGNYASKSLLVVGDTLKMFEENGLQRFKQIEHVKRHKTTGLLVKKDGKFRAITPEGSYKVLSESISHFNGEVGDEVVLHLPAGNLTSPFAAIETVHKKIKEGGETTLPDIEKKEPEVSKPQPKPTPISETKAAAEKKPKNPPPPKIEKPAPKKIEKEEVKELNREVEKEAENVPEPVSAGGSGEDELS